jgi:hypothetical protein
VRNVAVLGPFTVRDLTVFGATLILFIASLIPMFAVRYNLWNLGSLFFLGLGIVLPLILAALFVARRLAPETKVRIGSLSVDQFGSVVASFAVAFFFLSVAGAFTPSLLVALIGALVLFAATVLARFIPFFAGDFLDRAEVPAHITARESAVPVRTPKAPKPAKPTEQGKPAEQGKSAEQSPTAGGHKAAGRIFGGHKFGGQAAAQAPGTAAPTAGTPTAGAASAGAPTAGAATAGGAAAGAGIAGAGLTPSAGAWPAANAASSAAASPETGPAAVVPSAEAPAAARPAAVVPSAEAPAAARPAAAEPAAPAAEVTQLDGTPVTAAAAAGAGTATGNRPAAADAATGAMPHSAASATPATAVHQQVKPQEQVKSQEPIGATVDPASRPEEAEEQPVHEAFWFAVAQHRTAVDERTGAPLFGIEPGGWVLALEDRGDEFLVQHTDGRVGVLRDLSNIERG